MADEERGSTYDPFPPFAEWHTIFDPAVADLYAARLDARRAVVSEAAMDRAVEVATRYAAVDTGAIEGLYTTDRGFTRTIATQSAAWEATLAQRGESVARTIQDALNAYDMVLDAVTGSAPVSEAWIRQLHETICASQETYTVYTEVGPQERSLPKGSYKQMPNSPTNESTGSVHHYAPPDDTAPEMRRLVDELRTDQFLAAHPVLQAAYSHYAFVCVHPFADGNGRVARALASLYLYRRPGVPLVLFADQKDAYLDALEAADRGDAEQFVSFVEQRALDAIEVLIETSSAVSGRGARAAIEAIRRDSNGPSGLSHVELDALTSRLAGLVKEVLDRTASDYQLAPQITFNCNSPDVVQMGTPPDGFRSNGSLGMLWVLSGPAPASASISNYVGVWTRLAGFNGSDFLLADRLSGLEASINVRDIHPAESQLLTIKLGNFSSRFFDWHLDQLNQDTHARLVTMGYLSSDANE